MPTKYRVEISPDAELDIRTVQEHIARDKPRAARKWVGEVRRHIASLASLPERYEIIPEATDLGPHYRHILFGNYRVLFRVERARVIVLRVVHAARTLRPSMFDDS